MGDLVYVWRSHADYTGWSGPGIVIAESQNGRSLWISLRGHLVKAAREQVRQAGSEERLGAEVRKVISSEMLEKLESGKLKHYSDVEHEGGPPQGLERERELGEEVLGEVRPGDSITNHDGILDAIPEVEMEAEAADEPSTRATSVLGDVVLTPSVAETPATQTPNPSRRGSVIRVDEGSGGEFNFGPLRGSETPRPMPYPFSSQVTPWPAPSVPSNYFEVANVYDDQEEGARYWHDRPRGRWHPQQRSNKEFSLDNSHVFYSHLDKRFYLAKKKESPGQVDFVKLSEAEKEKFRVARRKEVQSLLESGAITILSIEESRKFRKEHPDYVLKSRFVDRYKPTEEFAVLPDNFDAHKLSDEHKEKVAPKSRWCVIGWRDPMIHAIERSSPTPLTQSIYLFMQLSATRSWGARVKDAKTAFLQGKPTTRTQKLACCMPRDGVFDGCDEECLILLNGEVYGLVSGPAWWRRSLLEVLVKELGYRVNVYDRCVLTLDAKPGEPEGETQGIIVIEIDDLLESGGSRHRKLMDQLEKRFRFGKVVCLMDHPAGTSYAGRRVIARR